MNIMSIHRVAQPLRFVMMVALTVTLTSCGARGAGSGAVPTGDPESIVRNFMNAVFATSTVGMGQLWGNSSGPASEYMDRATLEQRLTVIRIYLEHEEYAIVAGELALGTVLEPGERVVFVRLTRNGCTPTVPFTLVPYRNGWLIRDIDLAAAGNPSRRCSAGGAE